MLFLFGQYIIIPKKKIGHKQRGTTLERLGSFFSPSTVNLPAKASRSFADTAPNWDGT